MSDSSKSAQWGSFQGYSSPNYTAVPDELFDEQLADLSGAELKVLLYIIRRTFGFKKQSDNISLNQICRGIVSKDGNVLDRGTGLSQQSVLNALKGLIQKNAIIATKRMSKEKGNEPTTYALNILTPSKNHTPPSPKNREGLLKKNKEALPQKIETQETVIQQTDLQHRNSNSKLVSNGSNRNKEHTEFKAMGDLLKNKFTKKTIDLKEIPDSLKVTIDEISSEFGEKRNVRSNLTHVVRILQRSGKSPQNFTSYLYEARSITKQQGSVKKQMPYFFRVLEDVVGIQK